MTDHGADHGFDDELAGAFGTTDLAALSTVRTLLVETEPLVASTGFDDPLNPRSLGVELTDGIEAPGQFDVRWSELGNYSIHYSEPERDFRFDDHPNPHSPSKHVHLLPDARETEPSCITVERPELVTLAVLERWRAVMAGDLSALNDGSNPP